MAVVKPFRGTRYREQKSAVIKTLVAPPYDVISPREQEELYEKHEQNVVRLILGKEESSDHDKNNRYTRSASFFKEWQEKGILQEDEKPAFYVYTQEYRFKGVHKTRKGFIGRFKVEEFGKGKIHPHEKTLAKPKEDRLRLTRACRANFSPIFGLYRDEEDQIMSSFDKALQSPPLVEFEDDKKVIHRFWKVDDIATLEEVEKSMDDKEIMIADGHHRYETAVNYLIERKTAEPEKDDEGYHYVMMYFTNTESEGLSVFPTHRLVNGLTDYDGEKCREALDEYFHIASYPIPPCEHHHKFLPSLLEEMGEKGDDRNIFALYDGKGEYLLLTLKSPDIMDRLGPSDKSSQWKGLDVAILHTLIIEKVLGLTIESQSQQKNITYTVDEKRAAESVDEKEAQLALFLNPTKVREVMELSATGEKMPQKSTFFYPKLITGLVINNHDR